MPLGASPYFWLPKTCTLHTTLKTGAVPMRRSIREFATQPVIVWILLGGKPKWLLLNFRFKNVMRIALIVQKLLATSRELTKNLAAPCSSKIASQQNVGDCLFLWPYTFSKSPANCFWDPFAISSFSFFGLRMHRDV